MNKMFEKSLTLTRIDVGVECMKKKGGTRRYTRLAAEQQSLVRVGQRDALHELRRVIV